ncbi:MAG: helix-turn-helix domain-containing protein [Thermoleophilaceae bacterium]
MIEAIRREVPAYARPLEGAFGTAVRAGVEHALSHFTAMIRAPKEEPARGSDVYVGLGRGEARAGRSLEALLAAYRVGARVAWRQMAELGLESRLEPQALVRLAEAIFAYIDGLSAQSAEGYAREQAERAGEAGRRRELVIRLLIQSPPSDPAALSAAVEAAECKLAEEAAIVVWSEDAGRRLVARLPVGTIAERVDGLMCAVVPDGATPARHEQVRMALMAVAAGIGPSLPLDGAARSYRLARAALELAQASREPGPTFADERRLDLILRAERDIVADLARARMRPLESETPLSRARLETTLLAWLRNDGDVGAAARELIVHPQTVRYRMGRLREAFGDLLDDPDARFEIELVLRAAETSATAAT